MEAGVKPPRILVMRPPGSSLAPLRRVGLVYHVPVIRVKPVPSALAELSSLLPKADWLVLTSPRAPALLAPLRGLIARLRRERGLRIAVVGPATARALRRELGVDPDLIPASFHGRRLAEELLSVKPSVVVAARAARAVRDLVEVLRGAGVEVHEVKLYRTEEDEQAACMAVRVAAMVDYIVYTSPSIVDAFMKAARVLGVDPASLRALHVAIGPTTASRLRRYGVEPLYPEEYTLEGVASLIAAVRRRVSSNPHPGG